MVSLLFENLHFDEGGKTIVHKIFGGILTNQTKCLTCETVPFSFQLFNRIENFKR